LLKYNTEKYGYNYIRYIYDWVLSWAESPFGGIMLFTLAFAESSFFPIPPDVLLIALVLGARKKAFHFALYCSLASILGGMLGYLIGNFLWYTGNEFSSIANIFFKYIPGFTAERFMQMQKLYHEYSFWIVFTAGFTPIPYKLITVTAGVAKIDILLFLIASTISRSLRFFLVSALIYKYGETVRDFIEKKFNLLTIVFVILLVGGFILIKLIF